MLKGLTTKLFIVFVLFAAPLQALEVSAFERETDDEATITFCNSLKIENVSLSDKAVTPVIVLPRESDNFENLALLNSNIAKDILTCFEGVCDLRTSCKNPSYSLISARKVQDKDIVIANVAFDKDIKVVFLVSSYQSKNKTLYRVKTPQDFKFLSKRYQKTFRNWLIKQVKVYYEMLEPKK